jgi:hypothetical protein
MRRTYVTHIRLSNVCIGGRDWALSPLASTIVFPNYQWDATSGKQVYLRSTGIHFNRRSLTLSKGRLLNNLNPKSLSPITPCNGGG